ncbi:MAG: ABC transporter permease [Eubacterium sp.]|nr:ABC transporter permease [Eubacterium sp.]
MIVMLYDLVNNRTILMAGILYAQPITFLLLILFFIKSSRDERGRAIIGRASVIAIIVFIVIVNFFAKISDSIPINYDTVAFCVQWIYDIVVTVEVVAILIYRKIQ